MKKSREELLKSLDSWMLKAKHGGTKKKKGDGDFIDHAAKAAFHGEASDLHRQLSYDGPNAEHHRRLAMAHKAKQLKHDIFSRSNCPKHHWQKKQIHEDEIQGKVAQMIKQYANQDLEKVEAPK